MTDTHYAFVDRKCHYCGGSGIKANTKLATCPECNGTGMIGSFEEIQDIPMNSDDEFGNLLRKTRVRRLVSMSDLAALLKCKVSRISSIEFGIEIPTDTERKLLQEWIGE